MSGNDESQKSTPAVRQILMNELGLTRESVREEMHSIVQTEVAKGVAKLMNEGFLEKMVAAEFNKLAKQDHWDRDRIGFIVLDAARKQAEAFVRAHLRITAEA